MMAKFLLRLISISGALKSLLDVVSVGVVEVEEKMDVVVKVDDFKMAL